MVTGWTQNLRKVQWQPANPPEGNNWTSIGPIMQSEPRIPINRQALDAT